MREEPGQQNRQHNGPGGVVSETTAVIILVMGIFLYLRSGWAETILLGRGAEQILRRDVLGEVHDAVGARSVQLGMRVAGERPAIVGRERAHPKVHIVASR